MTSRIDELAYVVLDTVDVSGWAHFAKNILGFEVVRDGAGLRLRMDARPFRYLVGPGQGDRLPTLGWQAADAATIGDLAVRLAAIGLDATPLGGDALRVRQVAGGIGFRCHNGIDHEVVHGIDHEGVHGIDHEGVHGTTPGAPFVPSGDVSGFVTSGGGLGHVVWSVPDVEAMDRLMIDTFGMALREDIPTPAGRGHFYGCNARHHSLAVFSAPALRLEHLMVEMADLDDVGRAMDRVGDQGNTLVQPLGRHRTDHMVSFYVQTPSGFGMEIGCNGVLCDDQWADVRDTTRRRPWGHGAAMQTHRKAVNAAPQERQNKA